MSTTGPDTHDKSQDAAQGVALFGGVMLLMLGTFELLQGFAAVLNDDVFVRGIDYVYAIDVTAWGWWHLLIGAVGVATGLGIVKGQVWAYSAGIGFAVVSALGQFAFMPYYPFWSILIIALDVLIIWALAKQIGRG